MAPHLVIGADHGRTPGRAHPLIGKLSDHGTRLHERICSRDAVWCEPALTPHTPALSSHESPPTTHLSPPQNLNPSLTPPQLRHLTTRHPSHRKSALAILHSPPLADYSTRPLTAPPTLLSSTPPRLHQRTPQLLNSTAPPLIHPTPLLHPTPTLLLPPSSTLPAPPQLTDSSSPPLLHAPTRVTRTGRENGSRSQHSQRSCTDASIAYLVGDSERVRSSTKTMSLCRASPKHLSHRSGFVPTFVAMCLSFSIQSDLG
jgi:hypothetical protein